MPVLNLMIELSDLRARRRLKERGNECVNDGSATGNEELTREPSREGHMLYVRLSHARRMIRKGTKE